MCERQGKGGSAPPGAETAHGEIQRLRSKSSRPLLRLTAAVRGVPGKAAPSPGTSCSHPGLRARESRALWVGMGAPGIVVYSEGYQRRKDNKLVMLTDWKMKPLTPTPDVPSSWGRTLWWSGALALGAHGSRPNADPAPTLHGSRNLFEPLSSSVK